MAGDSVENSPKTYSLGELAGLLGVSIKGDPDIRIRGVGSLEEAREGELSFLTDARHEALLGGCKATALIVPPSFERLDYPLLISDRPHLALAGAVRLFASPSFPVGGVHPTAFVEDDSEIGEDVSIGPLAHVGSGSSIGSRSRIFGLAYIGSGVRIGEDCLIYPGVSILDGCRIGNRAIVHSGTVIGSDGFGFAQDELGRHVKILQTGIVQIEDDVEIGANCTVDRATFGRTVIGRGTKIDNLVQVAHNVTIGEHCILVAQVGISGSARLGGHVVLAGQVGVAGHVEIGDRVRVGAKSGVNSSVKSDQDLLGLPAIPIKEWLRTYSNIQRLARFKEELRKLEEKVRKLEEALYEE